MATGALPLWRRCASWVLAFLIGGIAPTLFIAATGRVQTWRGVGFTYLVSQTFSLFIGSLVWVTLGKLGSRIARLTPVWRWTVLVAVLLADAGIGDMAGVAFMSAMGWVRWAVYWSAVRESLLMAVLITLGLGIASFIGELSNIRIAQANADAERSRRAATQARLESLESRIHPHFLFNTLNSISALIREDPARAERLVERLAALLRFSLDASGLVPLERELKIVNDYLEIERARFGDRLRYTIDVPAEFAAVEVPPLSVQTLVENAVKHSIAPRREGGAIAVSASAGGALTISVTDDGPGFDVGALTPGHGLENLQARLAALYGDAARLDILRGDGQCTVRLTLPLKVPA